MILANFCDQSLFRDFKLSRLVHKGAVRKFCDFWIIHENHEIFDHKNLELYGSYIVV